MFKGGKGCEKIVECIIRDDAALTWSMHSKEGDPFGSPAEINTTDLKKETTYAF